MIPPITAPDTTTWMQRALCAQTGGDWWFAPETAEHREEIVIAKTICRLCDVKTECLAWAIAHDERHGIWGGMTRKGRTRLNHRLQIPVTRRTLEPAHGTEAGARHHHRLGQPACQACSKAAILAKERRQHQRRQQQEERNG